MAKKKSGSFGNASAPKKGGDMTVKGAGAAKRGKMFKAPKIKKK